MVSPKHSNGTYWFIVKLWLPDFWLQMNPCIVRNYWLNSARNAKKEDHFWLKRQDCFCSGFVISLYVAQTYSCFILCPVKPVCPSLKRLSPIPNSFFSTVSILSNNIKILFPQIPQLCGLIIAINVTFLFRLFHATAYVCGGRWSKDLFLALVTLCTLLYFRSV